MAALLLERHRRDPKRRASSFRTFACMAMDPAFSLDDFNNDLNDQLTVSQVQANAPTLAVPPGCEVNLPCPVHGEVVLPDEVKPFLCTHPFKRLKALKQLGVCSQVRLLWWQ